MPALSSLKDPSALTLAREAPDPFAGDGPRERAAQLGIEALADEDLLALVLGTGGGGESVRLRATRLLDECGGLLGLVRRGSGGLSQARGLGQVKALRILAGCELGRRAHVRELRKRGHEPGERFRRLRGGGELGETAIGGARARGAVAARGRRSARGASGAEDRRWRHPRAPRVGT